MSRTAYFNLSIPAPRRLAMMRADFAAHATKYPHCPEHAKPASWRDVRNWGLHNWQAAFCTFSAGAGQWYSQNGETFRNERDATSTGWYTDDECCETAIGIIANLPHGRFIAGYRWTSNDERVYFPDVFDDETDAARMAGEHARVFAESAYEDNRRFRAMADAESLVESKESDLCDAWQEYRAAWCGYLADARHAGAAIKAREWVRELVSDLRAFRRELTDATNAYNRG